jgi:hypothetical protein
LKREFRKVVYVSTIGLDYLLSIKREMELGVAYDLELGNYLVRF